MAKPFTDLMVDLETLDTQSSAVILQIGWCFFNRADNRSYRTWGWYLKTDEQVSAGATVSAETMAWWVEDNRDEWSAQQEADRKGMDEVFHEMQQVWNGCADENTLVWAKGTHFDFPILTKFFEAPWDFRNIHDLRTLKLIGKLRGFLAHVDNARPHHAVNDAMCQAAEVQAIWNVLQS